MDFSFLISDKLWSQYVKGPVEWSLENTSSDIQTEKNIF